MALIDEDPKLQVHILILDGTVQGKQKLLQIHYNNSFSKFKDFITLFAMLLICGENDV